VVKFFFYAYLTFHLRNVKRFHALGQERMRGITISAAAITLPWAGHQATLVSLLATAHIFIPANRREKSIHCKKFVSNWKQFFGSGSGGSGRIRIIFGSWIRIGIGVKGWIRIRIKVKIQKL
jgi:hypothetical protein